MRKREVLVKMNALSFVLMNSASVSHEHIKRAFYYTENILKMVARN
jgi:hypothetical protein